MDPPHCSGCSFLGITVNLSVHSTGCHWLAVTDALSGDLHMYLDMGHGLTDKG